MVQDASYFVGLLRQKINEITVEIGRMRSDADKAAKDSAVLVQYERKYDVLIKEVRGLEGDLADYNLAMDKSRTSMVRCGAARVCHPFHRAQRCGEARLAYAAVGRCGCSDAQAPLSRRECCGCQSERFSAVDRAASMSCGCGSGLRCYERVDGSAAGRFASFVCG